MPLKKILTETRVNAYYPNPEGGYDLVSSSVMDKLIHIKEGAKMLVTGFDKFFFVNELKTISSDKKITYLYNLYPLKE